MTRLIVGGCPAGPGGPGNNVSTVVVVDSSDSTPNITVIGAQLNVSLRCNAPHHQTESSHQMWIDCKS